MNWRKSTYSLANNNCVEVGSWRKSTHSQGASNCVEVGDITEIAIRDTKLGGSSPVLTVSRDTWTKFLRSLLIH